MLGIKTVDRLTPASFVECILSRVKFLKSVHFTVQCGENPSMLMLVRLWLYQIIIMTFFCTPCNSSWGAREQWKYKWTIIIPEKLGNYNRLWVSLTVPFEFQFLGPKVFKLKSLWIIKYDSKNIWFYITVPELSDSTFEVSVSYGEKISRSNFSSTNTIYG